MCTREMANKRRTDRILGIATGIILRDRTNQDVSRVSTYAILHVMRKRSALGAE